MKELDGKKLDGKSSNKFANFHKVVNFQLYLTYDALFLHCKGKVVEEEKFSVRTDWGFVVGVFFHVSQNLKMNHLTWGWQF